MKKQIINTMIIIIMWIISFAKIEAEMIWKDISNVDSEIQVITAREFNGKCYVIYEKERKHNVAVSEDKGKTWKKLHTNEHTIIDTRGKCGIVIDENNIVYFCAQSGGESHFMKSSDGGINWEKVYMKGKYNNQTIENDKISMNYLSMIDGLHGMAMGTYNNKPVLYKTTDGWKNVEIEERNENAVKVEGISDGVYYSYYEMISKDTVIKSGYYDGGNKTIKTVVSYSFDGGKTYSKHQTINEDFYTLVARFQFNIIKKTKAGFWVLLGGKSKPIEEKNGRVYKCKNLGDEWEEIFYEDYYSYLVADCDFYDENNGVVTLMEKGHKVYRTNDGGKSWKADTLFTADGEISRGGGLISVNMILYSADTAVLISSNINGNVFRLEELKSQDYDVDKLHHIKLIAKGKRFRNGKLQFTALANMKDANECWIDINNNKKREENEGLKVYHSSMNAMPNDLYVNRKEVTIYGKFKDVSFPENDIEEVHIGQCPSLTSIEIKDNPLKRISSNECENLKYCSLSNCSEITLLDLKKNTKLSVISIYNCPLTELYLPKSGNIIRMIIDKTKLKEIDISSIKERGTAVITNNSKLKKLITGDSTKLATLVLQETNDDISTMDFSGLKQAKNIEIKLTSLTEIDLSECKKLENVEINNNRLLTKIVLPDAKKLSTVDVSQNLLDEIVYTKNNGFRIFNCGNNGGITSLNFEGFENLETVKCFRNKITGEEADKLIESLPDRSKKAFDGLVSFKGFEDEGKYKVGNWAYAYSVEKARAKSWDIMYDYRGFYRGVASVSEGTMKVFNIYPNPAGNTLNIPEYETLITDIEIYNSSLDQVKILSPAAKIDISELPIGVYYIKLNYVMHKFVKK